VGPLRPCARSPQTRQQRRISSGYLLSGLIYCGKCGRALQGGSAKSGRFRYYGCYNKLRKGDAVCNARMVNTGKIERVIVGKLKERVLTPENLTELLRLTNDELQRHTSVARSEIQMLEKQVQAREAKLERLYEALESNQLSLGDLAPRIQKIKGELDQFRSKISGLRIENESSRAIPVLSSTELKVYVEDLHSLLLEGTMFEQRAFLQSFIKRIAVNYPEVTVEYTVPLMKKPPKESEVLSFVKQSGVDETRTRGLLRDRQAF
jgi:site-specific DNA recombinase